MLDDSALNSNDDGFVEATVMRWNRVTGEGRVQMIETDEKLQIVKTALVCEEDMERFVVKGQKLLLKKMEISPGNFMAVQIRDADGEPITHEWKKGKIKTYKSTPHLQPSQCKGVITTEDGEAITFQGSNIIGSTLYIRNAHCLYVQSKQVAVAVCGFDKQPFPNHQSKIVKPLSERENAIESRAAGEDYSKRYEKMQEAQEDCDGWPLPALFKGKVLFYHKSKSYGFITPVDSSDQQDPANIFFRQQQILIKGNSQEPRISGGEIVRFMVGIQPNGKPCACFVSNEDGSPIDAKRISEVSNKRSVDFMENPGFPSRKAPPMAFMPRPHGHGPPSRFIARPPQLFPRQQFMRHSGRPPWA